MEKNNSGIYPKGYRVLVRPDIIEEVTDGGIVIPAKQKEAHDRAQMTGHIVAVGEYAWEDYRKAPWAQVGDRVLYAQHQGQELTGKDGITYRLVNDEQVIALVDEGVDLSSFRKRESFAA